MSNIYSLSMRSSIIKDSIPPLEVDELSPIIEDEIKEEKIIEIESLEKYYEEAWKTFTKLIKERDENKKQTEQEQKQKQKEIKTTDFLRTVDKTIIGTLLHDFNGSEQLSESIIHKTENNSLILETDILTQEECLEIIKSSNKYSFSSLDTFDKNKRDADRLCIIDKRLAMLLWNRLKNTLLETKIKPFGIDVDKNSIWKPICINDCFRISKYKDPSIGFSPHYDSQYCENTIRRSALSLVIYLNDTFLGGDTYIYDIKDRKYVSGFTVQEDIALHGGIDEYTPYTITPKTGKCVMFEQNLLHKSNEIRGGNKYVLRTDVVYQLIDSCPVILGLPKEYDKCVTYFREAQNKELDGEIKESSELYEKAQSVSMASDKENIKYNIDIWSLIFEYLVINNILILDRVSRFHHIIKNKHASFGQCLKPIFPFAINKNLPPYIPQLKYIKGTECVFIFDNKSFFIKQKLKCLKIATMYAICNVGKNTKVDSYVANYNLKTKKILECDVNWLLICAYYNLSCAGSFYRLETDVKPQRFIYEGKLGKKRIPADTDYLFQYDIDRMLLKNPGINVRLDDMLKEDEKETYANSLTQFNVPGYTVFNKIRNYAGDYCSGTSQVDMNLNNIIFDFSKHKIDIKLCDQDCTFCKKKYKCFKKIKQVSNKEGFIADISNIDIKPYHHAGHVEHENYHRSTTNYSVKFVYTRLINKIHLSVYYHPTFVTVITHYDAVDVF
jgi:prolyl 4-hydroxylase